MVKVHNLESPRTGKPVANQFVITTDKGIYFQSYETLIAAKEKGVLTLDINALDYSRTTSKYLYQFTMMNRKELEAGIKEGIIKTRDLNR